MYVCVCVCVCVCGKGLLGNKHIKFFMQANEQVRQVKGDT